MTDSALTYPGSSRAAPFRPLDYLPEIAAFLIILFLATRLPSINKLTTLGWLGASAMLVLARPSRFAATLVRWWPLLLTPLLAAFSAYWSDAAAISLRYGLQLIVTALMAVYLTRLLTPQRFVIVLFLCMTVFCVLSIASGRWWPSATGMALIGLVGSKNQMGFMGFLLVLSSLAVLADAAAPRILRVSALPSLLLGLFVVSVVDSATAVVMAVAGGGLFFGLCILHRLPPAGRSGVMIAGGLISLPLIVLAPEINQAITDFLINVLHKDPGLTGRTHLWERAQELISRQPILGYGFQALWLGDTSEARSLLNWAGVADGRTFNFHSTYLQIGVDTGLVGMGIFITTIVAAALAAARRYILTPTVASSFFLALFVVMVAMSITEVVVVAFSTITFMLYIALGYAFRGAEQPVYAPPSEPAARGPRRPGLMGSGAVGPQAAYAPGAQARLAHAGPDPATSAQDPDVNAPR